MQPVSRMRIEKKQECNFSVRFPSGGWGSLRAGYFSYRWTDIFDQTGIPSETIVIKGQPADNSAQPQFKPHDVDAVVAAIQREKPSVVFAPHVETSTVGDG